MRSALLFILLAAVAAACLGVGELANPPLPQWKFAPGDRVGIRRGDHYYEATIISRVVIEGAAPGYYIAHPYSSFPVCMGEGAMERTGPHRGGEAGHTAPGRLR